MTRDHMEGFEREEKFNEILGQARRDVPVIKFKTIEKIIAGVCPDFLKGLFESRPCVRKLRYIGCPCKNVEVDDYFQIGQIYESIEFNGGTYTIKGYYDGQSRIGWAYFEWID